MSSINIHTEIFSPNQAALLALLKPFNRSFYLVGGTAIALYLGHRRSIDFDFFTYTKRLNKTKIRKELLKFPFPQQLISEDDDQMHFLINGVKITFFNYPYAIENLVKTELSFRIPSLLTLAAMKAFALGRRAKWKDYVDLYYMIHNHFTINEIAQEANQIFATHFSEKLFREQLAYHKDIDYSEQVEFLAPKITDHEIKSFLLHTATDIF